MKGTFVSIWDNGSVRTPATLDTETGEVTTNSVEADDNLGTLMEEWFESNESFNAGEEYEICPECHEYILKTVMKDGIGSTLYEARVCSDSDCENQ